jgi:pyruvate/2-oxoglutarate dehydrogenase complex dihydrolipoamide dehydrogenase (E3) component
MNKTIAVIGGGPAGIEAALAASGRGRRVLLVQDGPFGGRAVWQTLLPAKIWLEAARQAQICKNDIQISSLRERYLQVAKDWQQRLVHRLRNAGVELIQGTAVFESAHVLRVNEDQGSEASEKKRLEADAVIIATGWLSQKYFCGSTTAIPGGCRTTKNLSVLAEGVSKHF